MRLVLLQLPLYLWVVFGLAAVVVIVLFGVACVRIIKRSDRDKTDKVAVFLLLMLSSVTAQAMEGDGSFFNPYRIASVSDWNTVAAAGMAMPVRENADLTSGTRDFENRQLKIKN